MLPPLCCGQEMSLDVTSQPRWWVCPECGHEFEADEVGADEAEAEEPEGEPDEDDRVEGDSLRQERTKGNG